MKGGWAIESGLFQWTSKAMHQCIWKTVKDDTSKTCCHVVMGYNAWCNMEKRVVKTVSDLFTAKGPCMFSNLFTESTIQWTSTLSDGQWIRPSKSKGNAEPSVKKNLKVIKHQRSSPIFGKDIFIIAYQLIITRDWCLSKWEHVWFQNDGELPPFGRVSVQNDSAVWAVVKHWTIRWTNLSNESI